MLSVDSGLTKRMERRQTAWGRSSVMVRSRAADSTQPRKMHGWTGRMPRSMLSRHR